MENVAGVVKQDLDCDFSETPGAGAAGGLGFGLLSFCQASIRSGFDLVAEALHLEEQIASSDLIITGEGSLDSQTLEGKGPAGVAALAQRHGKPVIAFAGSISGDASIFDAACPLVDRPASLEEAMTNAGAFLRTRGLARGAASRARKAFMTQPVAPFSRARNTVANAPFPKGE